MKKLFFVMISMTFYHLNAQDLVTSTPFELYGDHIFLSLSVDDSRPIDFIFDTGDGLAVLDTDIAKELGLASNHVERKVSAQGSISGHLIEHNKVEINDVKIEDIELYTTELEHIERSIGRNIDGIIGYDLLKNFTIKIDYDEMLIKIYKKGTFQYTGNGEGFNFHLVNYIPTVEATVTLNNGESFTEPFFLNTGAGTTLDFNTPFANKHGVIDKTGEHYSYPVAGLEDNETMHYEGRVKEFSLGTINLTSLPIGISQAEHGVQHSKKAAGIIGNGLLQHFNITLDYEASKIYLEANKKNKEPFKVDASGLNLQYSQGMKGLLVHRVYSGSAAEAAGIKQDAELLEINGQSVAGMELPEIKETLKGSGKKVNIKFKQNGVEQEAVLDLNPLL